MTLEKYLQKHALSAIKFAALAGLAVSTITRIKRGEQRPSAETAFAIERATGGKVKMRELVAE